MIAPCECGSNRIGPNMFSEGARRQCHNAKVAQPTTVLFDWDGTLCDSGDASLRAFRSSMADCGIAFTDEQYRAVYTPRWYHMYEALGLPRDLWPKADERWLHHYGEEPPCLMAGAVEVVRELAGREFALALVTNATRPRIERELDVLGWTALFRAVVCHEDVTHSKPHPEGVLRALALAGGSPESCWYVGDTPADIEQGRAAGVFTVGVRTQFVDPARLAAAHPDLLLDGIGELPAALYRFTSTASSNTAGES